MALPQSYHKVKRAIVAFCPKYFPGDNSFPQGFPPIIGTGFVVRQDGLIITNDHVLRAFLQVPRDAEEGGWPVFALLLHPHGDGLLTVPLEIIGVGELGAFPEGSPYAGHRRPDIGLVHVKAVGLPTIDICADTVLEGTDLATAGYAMGRDAIAPSGWIQQVGPTLQRGIVSAVLPFSMDEPYAFTLNVMTQGGASGSPVFKLDTAEVVSVLYAGLIDIATTYGGDRYAVPTNISYVVPAHSIHRFLQSIETQVVQAPDTPTLDQIVETIRKSRKTTDWIVEQTSEENRTVHMVRGPSEIARNNVDSSDTSG